MKNYLEMRVATHVFAMWYSSESHFRPLLPTNLLFPLVTSQDDKKSEGAIRLATY